MEELRSLPSDIPEKGTYNYYLHILDSQLMPGLVNGLEELAERPTPDRLEVVGKIKEQLVDNYELAVAYVIVDDENDESVHSKETVIQTLREGESQKRIEEINRITGKKLLKPREYPAVEYSVQEIVDQFYTQTLSIDRNDSIVDISAGIDAHKWAQFEIRKFIQELDEDLNKIIVHLDENHPYAKQQRLKNKMVKKGKEVATIAGSVALGVLVSRTLDRRKFN